jgi:Predicted membrane protein
MENKLIIYFLFVNLMSFLIMGMDKWRAKNGARRVSEARLFTLAIMGGSVGTLLAMYTFRHKTKHKSFVFGIPAILIIQLVILAFFLPAK